MKPTLDSLEIDIVKPVEKNERSVASEAKLCSSNVIDCHNRISNLALNRTEWRGEQYW